VWGTHAAVWSDTVPLRELVPPANIANPLQYRVGAFVAPDDVKGRGAMLWTIVVILLVLWLLGMVSSVTAGGLVHLLLVIAFVVIVFQFISGRRSI
jgi:hypothetical protein